MYKKLLGVLLFGAIFIFLPGQNIYAVELININTADAETLDTLPGIGAAKAQAIIDYRESNGNFQATEDIMNVSGIGQVTYDNMKDLITVGATETPPENPAPPLVENNTEIIEVIPEVLGYEIKSVVINELVSDPADGEVEFVELYNNKIMQISLEDWWIEEGSGRKTILSGNIAPNGFFVVDKPKGNLNNAGDIIKLFDPAGGLIDKISYGKWDDGNIPNNAERPDDPMSLARNFDGQDTDEDNKDFSLTEIITKGFNNVINNSEKIEIENKIVESADLPAQVGKIPTEVGKNKIEIESESLEIINENKPSESIQTESDLDNLFYIEISEIMPNPLGSDNAEFIELYNPSDKSVDLSGAKLDDEEGGSRAYVIPSGTILGAGEYMSFGKEETKITLNNTTDSVRLLYFDNSLIREITYDRVIEGASFVKTDEDEWVWTNTATPGKFNIITIAFSKSKNGSSRTKPVVETDLEDLRKFDKGDRVKVSGIVAIEPGVFGTQYFYIVGENSGVQVYMYKKDFGELNIGDRVEITGEISEAYSETRIKVSKKEDIVRIEEGLELIPREVDMDVIDESLEGSFVKVSGEITEIKGSYMYVDDGTGELQVYFKKGSSINKKLFKVGDLVDVKGLVSERKSGYQLLPRAQEDIEKIGVAEEFIAQIEGENKNEQKEVAEKYLTATAGGLTSILIGFLARARGAIAVRGIKKLGLIALALVKRK